MKVLLLVGRVSLTESHSAGDTIDVSDKEAYSLISTNQAEPKTKKEYTNLLKRINSKKERDENKAQKLLAVEKEEELKAEAHALVEELYAVVGTIQSVDNTYRLDISSIITKPFDLSKISSTKKEA